MEQQREDPERGVTYELQLGRHRVQVLPCTYFSYGQFYVSRSFCCSVCPPTLQSRGSQGGRDEGCLELVILSSLWILVSPTCGRIAAFPGPCPSSYFGLMCRREWTLSGRFSERPCELLFSCCLGGRKESTSAKGFKEYPQEAETPQFPFSHQSSWFTSVPCLPVGPGT